MTVKTVLISGYYGFGNLGDELILEELINEIRQIDVNISIIVLSNQPEYTSKIYNVNSINRYNLVKIINALMNCDLLISGGGGLFQDASSYRPPLYYGFIILLARLLRVKIFIYAQGLGPINSTIAKFITLASLSMANIITLRDHKSLAMAKNWQLNATLTADPVWNLVAPQAKDENVSNIDQIIARHPQKFLIGLSLRSSNQLSENILHDFCNCLSQALNKDQVIVLLPLQKTEDYQILQEVKQQLTKYNITVECLDLNHENFAASTYLTVFAKLNFVIAMRLHALILALKCGINVFGLAYDPKVTHLLNELKLPYMLFPQTIDQVNCINKLKTALNNQYFPHSQITNLNTQAKINITHLTQLINS